MKGTLYFIFDIINQLNIFIIHYRFYSFYIETSVDENKWELVVDKRNERLQSWQTFTFEQRPISFIRLVGTANSANEMFHIVHFECSVMQQEQAQDKSQTQEKNRALNNN